MNDSPTCTPTAEASDLCGAPAGQACEPGCPSLAVDPPHAIENHAKVYLDWIDGAWVVSGTSFDGYALDGLDDGAQCDVTHGDPEEQAECEALLKAADEAGLPTGEELYRLMADFV